MFHYIFFKTPGFNVEQTCNVNLGWKKSADLIIRLVGIINCYNGQMSKVLRTDTKHFLLQSQVRQYRDTSKINC